MGNFRRVAGGWILVLAAVALSSCASAPEPRPVERPLPPAPQLPLPQQPADTGPSVREPQPVLVGTVTKVTDGDTIHVQLSSGPIIVRLHSIDAPEHDQPWGDQARIALAGRIAGRQVALEVESQDRYERLVAQVYLGDENINAWMVRQGNAWAYRQYLDDKNYCVWEGIARASRRGLWSLPPRDTHAPWEWRAVKRGTADHYTDSTNETVANCIAAMHGTSRGARPPTPHSTQPPPAAQPSGQCHIKGNISGSGKIYHVPGSPHYDRTQIDTSKGERWFCTVEQAEAAGWRAPRI